MYSQEILELSDKYHKEAGFAIAKYMSYNMLQKVIHGPQAEALTADDSSGSGDSTGAHKVPPHCLGRKYTFVSLFNERKDFLQALENQNKGKPMHGSKSGTSSMQTF